MAAAKSLVSFPELQRDNFEEGNTGTEHFVWNADLRAPVKIDNVETDSKNDMETKSKDDMTKMMTVMLRVMMMRVTLGQEGFCYN